MKIILSTILIFFAGDLIAQNEPVNSLIQKSYELNFTDIILKSLTKPLLGCLIIFFLLLSAFFYKEKKPIPLKVSLLNLIAIGSYSLILDCFSWSETLKTTMMAKLIIIFLALNIVTILSLFGSLKKSSKIYLDTDLISIKKCSHFIMILIPIIAFLPVTKGSSLILFTGLIIIFFFFIHESKRDNKSSGSKNHILSTFNSISTSVIFLVLIIMSSNTSVKNQSIFSLPFIIVFYLSFIYYIFKKDVQSFYFKLHFTTPILLSSLALCGFLFLGEPIQKNVLLIYITSSILFQFCFLFLHNSNKKKEWENWREILLNEVKDIQEGKIKAVQEAEESLFKLEVQEMNNEDMMDNLYNQKKARESILNCLNQGVISFNKEGDVLEGSTRVAEKLLNQNLFESELLQIKVENILNLSEEKRDAFKETYQSFFRGEIDFDRFKERAPNLFQNNQNRSILLEYIENEANDEGVINSIILLITDRTKEIESDKAIAEREYELEMSKMELEYMMEHLYEQKHKRDVLIDNLKEGYLTINDNGIIEEGASSACNELFGQSLYESEIKKIKFSDLWKKSPEKKNYIDKWIRTIWSGIFQFKDLIPLAPKQFDERSDKYIELEYRPIFNSEDGKQNENGDFKIKNVIVIASDKTKEKQLMKKIDKDKEEAYFIKTCLQNPEEFLDLINESYSFLIDRPEISDLSDNKEFFFRKFHTMKAQYAQFKIRNISEILHSLEETLENQMWDLFFKKLDQLENNMNELFSEHRLLIQAANKLLIEQGNSIPSKDIIQHIEDVDSLEDLKTLIRKDYILKDFKSQFKKFEALIDELAKELDKSVTMEFRGDDILVDTEKYQTFFNCSIHLFRNIMDHGIETKYERNQKDKNESGLIVIKTERVKNKVILTIRDDGKGIDPLGVKIKVLEKELKEPKELDSLKENELLDLIFLPGFSTRDTIDHISGRGVGTDAVRYEVEKIGGTIKVESTIDVETIFTIILPIIS